MVNGDEEEEIEHVDEVLAEVNDWDQTLLAAGLGGAEAEEEDAALRLQQQLEQQRQQRERSPPEIDSDDSADLRRRFRNLRRRSVRPRLMTDEDLNSIVGHDTEEEEEDTVEEDTRPVIPDPPSPLSLDLSAGK